MLQGIENIALAIPAFTALSVQTWLIAHSDKRRLINKNWPILLFFLGVLGMSFLEFSSYAGIVGPSLFSIKLWYAFCSITFSGILILSMKISGIVSFQAHRMHIFVVMCSIAYSTLMLSTNSMIQGIQSIGYSATRIPGDLYFITQFYAAALIALTLFCLTTGTKVTEDNSDKKRARVLLYSTSPFLFIFLALLLLMAIGVKVNASVIIPLATTYMLLVLVITEQKESLFSLLLKIPFSKERKSYKQITQMIEDFLSNTDNGEQVSLKTLISNIEQQVVSMAVQMSNGSQVKAASLLNVSASSICRKKKETHKAA